MDILRRVDEAGVHIINTDIMTLVFSFENLLLVHIVVEAVSNVVFGSAITRNRVKLLIIGWMNSNIQSIVS